MPIILSLTILAAILAGAATLALGGGLEAATLAYVVAVAAGLVYLRVWSQSRQKTRRLNRRSH